MRECILFQEKSHLNLQIGIFKLLFNARVHLSGAYKEIEVLNWCPTRGNEQGSDSSIAYRSDSFMVFANNHGHNHLYMHQQRTCTFLVARQGKKVEKANPKKEIGNRHKVPFRGSHYTSL